MKETIRSPRVVVYLTAKENLSNPSETSLYFINFYVLELEFVMTKGSILLITIQNWILFVFDRARREANATEKRERH